MPMRTDAQGRSEPARAEGFEAAVARRRLHGLTRVHHPLPNAIVA
jgi:hypothetical protein